MAEGGEVCDNGKVLVVMVVTVVVAGAVMVLVVLFRFSSVGNNNI